MELALKNLQSGSSIKALAFDLGFSSEHAFSKAFRNHFHLPPQQFLHALSEKDCESARLELRRLL